MLLMLLLMLLLHHAVNGHLTLVFGSDSILYRAGKLAEDVRRCRAVVVAPRLGEIAYELEIEEVVA